MVEKVPVLFDHIESFNLTFPLRLRVCDGGRGPVMTGHVKCYAPCYVRYIHFAQMER